MTLARLPKLTYMLHFLFVGMFFTSALLANTECLESISSESSEKSFLDLSKPAKLTEQDFHRLFQKAQSSDNEALGTYAFLGIIRSQAEFLKLKKRDIKALNIYI